MDQLAEQPIQQPIAPFIREINQLHDFFTAWLAGQLPQTKETFSRFTDVTAQDFTLISPQGSMVDRHGAEAWIWDAHGRRPGLHIWIERPQIRAHRGDVTVICYEEWQAEGETTSARLSTAVFVAAADTPNGIRWLHVHETWLPTAT